MMSKYEVVVKWIDDQIKAGKFKSGEKLPSENDLAKKFDMSRQTVRRAIEILEHKGVLKRIKGSGTYLKKAGRGIRNKSCKNIAVVSTYIDNYVFPPTLGGIEHVLSENGYTVQIAFTENNVLKEREVLAGLLENDNIDGLILEPAKSALPSLNLDLYNELEERHIPILLFNCAQVGLSLPCVSLDDEKIGYKCAEYLIKAGHKKIGGFFKSDDRQGHLRYAGFMKALIEAEIACENVIWFDTESIKDFEMCEKYILKRLEGLTGVVCYNDMLAYKVAALCGRSGVNVPEDLSLVGVDHLEQFSECDPWITSFPHPLEALGVKAAENMLKMIKEPFFDGGFLFDADVCEGDSVKILNKDF